MDPVTRRSFLVRGSVGAVGVAGLAGGGLALRSAADDAGAALSADELGGAEGPLVLHIADPAAGKVEVLVGEREVRFTDPSLVARVVRATR